MTVVYMYVLGFAVNRLRRLFGGTTSIIIASSGEVRISTGLSERDAELLADAAYRYSTDAASDPSQTEAAPHLQVKEPPAGQRIADQTIITITR